MSNSLLDLEYTMFTLKDRFNIKLCYMCGIILLYFMSLIIILFRFLKENTTLSN